jgi:ubiquinone biosynthesis protein
MKLAHERRGGVARFFWPLAAPADVRSRLEKQGPVFVKIGQYLALRPDLLPQEYCDELLEFVDRAPSFPWEEARAIIEEDLGTSLEQSFATVDPAPLAAATIAQVHAGRLRSGESVVLKVRRPGIEQRIDSELRKLGWLWRGLEMIGAVPPIRRRELLSELKGWLLEEMDFRRELRNLQRLHALTADAAEIRVPRPYPELSGSNLLTQERLDGVPFSELIRLQRQGESERIARMGFDPARLGENLALTLLRQIFILEFFHADPHPGNLLALDGNRVGYVDFGLVDRLDPTVRRNQARYLDAVVRGDTPDILASVLEILEPGPGADVNQFRAEFLRETRRWRLERDLGGPEAGLSTAFAAYLKQLMRAARKSRMVVPRSVLSMYRAVITAETVATQMSPQADLIGVARGFLDEYRDLQTREQCSTENVDLFVSEWTTLLRQSPGRLNRLMTDLSENRLVIHATTADTSEVRRLGNCRARLVTLAIVSVALSVLLAGSQAGGLPFRTPIQTILLVLLGTVAAAMAFLWFRLRS